MAFRVITVVLNASTAGLTAGLGRAGAQVAGFSQQMNRALGWNPKPLTAGIAGVTVALGYSVLAAVQFEAKMRNVASIDERVSKNFREFSDQILEMSRHLPQSANNLAEGFYQVASSGFYAKDAITILKQSAIAATAGLSTTSQAVTAITASLNAYGLQANSAKRVSDALFAAVDYGVITFPQMTQALSHVIGTAAKAGITIEDMATGLAVMTRSGLSASESGVSLNQVLSKLLKPSKALAAAALDLGIDLQKGLRDPAIGLKGVMDQLRVASEGNVATLLKWFPEIRAARGVLALMANDGRLYNTIFNQMGNANLTAGLTQKAFNEQMKATSAQMKEAWNQINAFAIGLGTHLLPGIQKAISSMADFFHLLSTAGSELWSRVGPGFASLGHSLQNIGQLAKGVLTDLAPLLVLIAGISIGTAVAAFRALAAALQGVTGFLADNKDAVVAVGIALSTLLLPALGRLAATLGLHMVLGLNAALIGLGRMGTLIASINPLILAAQVGIGLLAFSFIKSRQETAKFNGAVKDMTGSLAAARSQGPQNFMKALSDAIAPLAPMLREAGVAVGPLVNNLSKGGAVATKAWNDAKTAALDHARSMGANKTEINAISKSYDIVGKSLGELNEQTKTGVEAEKAQTEAIKSQLAQLDPLAKAKATLEVREKAWGQVMGESRKALSDQTDLLKENTKEHKINASQVQQAVRDNIATIAKENENIVKLQAAGLPAMFIQQLIDHGPEYVGAVASMGKRQMKALGDEWAKGQGEVNRLAALRSASAAPEQAKAYGDALRTKNDELAKVLTDVFVGNLRTAVTTARTIAAGGGQTTVDEYGRKVHQSASQVLNAYIHSLPEPLRTAVQQALGIAGPGGRDIVQKMANAIVSESGASTGAARMVKDKILAEFNKIAPGIEAQKGNITSAAQGIATSLNRALDQIGHKVDIDVQARLQSIIGKQSYVAGRGATGGRIRGPGTGTSDTAGLFALSNDEWVINQASTAMYGHDAMDSVNRGTATIIPGMATGGKIGKPWIYNVQGHPPSLDSIASSIGKLAMDNIGSLLGAFGVGGGIGGFAGAQAWAPVFAQALAMAGQSAAWLPLGLRRLAQESGGNPTAVNRTDSNWRAGTPSVGLMQVIGPTFRAWAGILRNVGPFLYGTSVNPLANIYAAIRYTMGAYGTLAAWGRPGGYATGLDYVPYDGFRATLHRGERIVPASRNTSSVMFAPIVNIHVMGGDSPQITAQAIRREVQGVMGNYVRQLRVGTGRY